MKTNCLNDKPACKTRCFKIALLVVTGIAAVGLLVMLLWNWLMPELFCGCAAGRLFSGPGHFAAKQNPLRWWFPRPWPLEGTPPTLGKHDPGRAGTTEKPFQTPLGQLVLLDKVEDKRQTALRLMANGGSLTAQPEAPQDPAPVDLPDGYAALC